MPNGPSSTRSCTGCWLHLPLRGTTRERSADFVRAFGSHQPDRTPCGEPISASQAHALTELALQPLTQAELARRLRLDRSFVSRLADTLSDRAWLRRERHPQDQRAVQLVLTEQGQAAADRVAGARRARLTTLLDAVPASEHDNVLRALHILTKSLTQTGGPADGTADHRGTPARAASALGPIRGAHDRHRRLSE